MHASAHHGARARLLGPFHRYVLREDYDIMRGCAAAALPEHAAPRRLRHGETLESLEQADVIFSRTDADEL